MLSNLSKFILYIFTLFITLSGFANVNPNDSVNSGDSIKEKVYFGYLCNFGSSLKYSNETKQKIFTLNDQLNLDLKSKNYKGFAFALKFKQDLAYSIYIDSLSKKDMDKLFLMIEFSKVKSKSSFKCMIDGPFLNSFKYKYNYKTKVVDKTLSGYFLNPSIINIGYGYTTKLFRQSLFTFNYLNLVARIEPVFGELPESKQGYVLLTKKSVWTADYGYSMVLDIKENLLDNVEFNFFFSSYGSGLSRLKMFFDVSAALRYYPVKYLSVTLSSKLMYNPIISLEGKILSEISLGYCLKPKK